MEMRSDSDLDSVGVFEERYKAFIDTMSELRPDLHRYCARITGSVFDGEDVVQEALFEAYRKLDKFDDRLPLKPWLYRIAHNRAIDFLRNQKVRNEAETALGEPAFTPPLNPSLLNLAPAVERLVINLPPMERACVLLKDVFDYSLEEIAELVGSTVGGVKSALNKGRSKLARTPPTIRRQTRPNPQLAELLRLYVERFNRQDWNAVRELIHADARLRVTDIFAGRMEDKYFTKFSAFPYPWQLATGELDQEQVVFMLGGWIPEARPSAVVRFDLRDSQIETIRHYNGPWLFTAAETMRFEESV
jgi:RNA polymerase sigma-70 factor, ECF subfamily